MATRVSRNLAFGPEMRRGLFLLRQAYDYAAELHRDVWDFAVEIASLRDAGLTASDLRWMVHKGYVEHALEITMIGRNGREFQSHGNLSLTEQECFVLTEAGAEFAPNIQQEAASARDECHARWSEGPAVDNPAQDVPSDRLPSDPVLVPKWDHNRHELRIDGCLVKVFKQPSRNQETILMAFEEEGWPPRIDDPLPPHPSLDPKRRLHDAIKGLNRNRKSRKIRFMGDGTGEGVRWELSSESNENGEAWN